MKKGLNTELLYTGERPEGIDVKAEAPPIFMTTAFVSDSLEEFFETSAAGGYGYNRSKNPNRQQLAEMIDMLEGGVGSVITASGMGAISSTLFSLLKPGDHILANESLYTESMNFFGGILTKFGITHSFVNMGDLEAVRAAVQPNTKVFFSEVVSNPMTYVVDIDAVAKIAHNVGALLVIDNTFTTAVAIKPLDHGADIVVNSMTKFMNGHSDATAGAVTGKDAEIMQNIRYYAVTFGLPCDAHTAWLVQRGLFTLGLRVTRQMENATKLAHALEADSRVVSVSHPSLKSHPQHDIAVRLMGENMGAMMVVRLPDDMDLLYKFTEKLELVRYAPTLGGLHTTYAHPARTSHRAMTEEKRNSLGIYDGCLRVSVGFEDIDDVIADFKQALTVYDKN